MLITVHEQIVFIDRSDIHVCHIFGSPFVLYLVWAICSFTLELGL